MKKLISGLVALALVFGSAAALPQGVELFDTAIEVSAENYGDLWYNVLDDETIEITEYTGEGGDAVIPGTIDGKKVTSIGDYAFDGCTSLESINIPDGVTSIGEGAFYYCTSLKSINLPDSVTSIGDKAFYNCEKLTGIVLPDGVTSIGDSAFWGCTSLESISLPGSVTSIGESAFDSCTSLEIINVDEANTTYSSSDGALYNKDKTTLLLCPEGKTTITIPGSVTSIGDSAFWGCTSLESISIPGSVTSIGDYAFQDCESLKSISIPDSVTSIGYGAFWGCTSLEIINVDEANTTYSSSDGALYNKDKTTLLLCPLGKTSITIPGSVTSIGDEAFYSCEKITGIVLPDGVTSIGDYAFDSCESLTSINIPDGVTSVGNYAFRGCEDLTIYGNKGSAAEQYAADNGFTFVDLATVKPGDADGSGAVDLLDVMLMQQYIATWTVNILPFAADYDGDNEVTIIDVMLTQQDISGWFA